MPPAACWLGLVVLPTLGIALRVSRSTGRGLGTGLFQAVAGLTLALYAFGLVGALWPGALCLFAGGVALGVREVARGPREALRRLASPAAVLWVGLAVAHAWIFADARYAFWDEFDQWGLATRELVLTDALYGLASNVSRPTAPPGAAVWHYFVCRPLHYAEGATYTANFLLFLAPLLPLFDGIRRHRVAWVAVTTAALLLVTANLGHGSATAMVDHLLGSFFAGTLVLALAEPEDPWSPWLMVAPLAVLALLKESGLFLALAAAAFVPFHRALRQAFAGKWREGWAAFLRPLAGPALLVAVPLAAVGSWQLRAALLPGPAPAVEMWSVAGSLFSDGQPDAVDRRVVHERMREVFLHQPLRRSALAESFHEFTYPLMAREPSARGLTTLGWLLASLALCGLWLALGRGARPWPEVVALWVFLPSVLAVYLWLLSDVYASDFGAFGIQIPGYDRYVNSVVLAMAWVPLALGFPVLSDRRLAERRSLLRVSAAGAVVLGLVLHEGVDLRSLVHVREQNPIARLTEGPTRRVLEATGLRGRIWVSHPQPADFLGVVVLRYQLTPLAVRIHTEPPAASTSADLLAEIGQSDFAWIFRTGPVLQAKLAGATPATLAPRALFRVDRTGPEVRLVPMRSGHQIDPDAAPPAAPGRTGRPGAEAGRSGRAARLPAARRRCENAHPVAARRRRNAWHARDGARESTRGRAARTAAWISGAARSPGSRACAPTARGASRPGTAAAETATA